MADADHLRGRRALPGRLPQGRERRARLPRRQPRRPGAERPVRGELGRSPPHAARGLPWRGRPRAGGRALRRLEPPPPPGPRPRRAVPLRGGSLLRGPARVGLRRRRRLRARALPLLAYPRPPRPGALLAPSAVRAGRDVGLRPPGDPAALPALPRRGADHGGDRAAQPVLRLPVRPVPPLRRRRAGDTPRPPRGGPGPARPDRHPGRHVPPRQRGLARLPVATRREPRCLAPLREPGAVRLEAARALLPPAGVRARGLGPGRPRALGAPDLPGRGGLALPRDRRRGDARRPLHPHPGGGAAPPRPGASPHRRRHRLDPALLGPRGGEPAPRDLRVLVAEGHQPLQRRGFSRWCSSSW